jgi:hypothetical protein
MTQQRHLFREALATSEAGWASTVVPSTGTVSDPGKVQQLIPSISVRRQVQDCTALHCTGRYKQDQIRFYDPIKLKCPASPEDFE